MKYKYERKINYYETDKMGVVHHSNYIRFLEEARCRWLENNGMSMETIERLGYTIPTLEVYCKYKKHVTSGDVITSVPSITEFNGARMKIEYIIKNKEDNIKIIDAWTTHCFTTKDIKPINIKKKQEEIYDFFIKLQKQNLSKK